ncbi:fucolectin-1-like [Crassostrea angulata]|uniref:fucolectin-1-like n=1 Tax=Magallana angulata TaxID=2784310 RepID=UPI0022B0E436|nr:fucolectin-1-like [Crassostrea angulata]
MQLQFFNAVICILALLHFSRNQQSRCTTFTMYIKFIGSLHDDRTKPLWEFESESLESAKYLCVRRCEKDHRCVGIEICSIGPDLSRCRGCCEWYVIDKDGGFPRNANDGCKYFELSKDSVESRGIRLSTNSNLLTAVASSIYGLNSGWPPSNALDGLHGNKCETGKPYISINEPNPWLEVKWSGTIAIQRIIIYNRFDCCGNLLVDLNVTYNNNGVTGICGFYPGLLSRNGDRILFFCPPEAHATSVKLQIQSKPDQRNMLNLCEVEVYKKT